MTRGERVIAFIEKYCVVPEGALVGQPLRLNPFQRKFILAVYDNPQARTRRAYLSIARKNGKTGLIAGLLLAHIVGPEARRNAQLISGAMSREQAALVFKLAFKMIQMSEELTRLTRIVPSSKTIIGLAMNTEFQAISAEGKTAHGLSPVLAILDEVGQVRGPQSDFVDAIVTSQGAHDDPLLIAISTQAPNDNDLFSIWLDDAASSGDPGIVSHVYTADKNCNLMDEVQWRKANPALGTFRSFEDLKEQAERAERMPSSEATFRNLGLNQRVELISPFISSGVWLANKDRADDEAFLLGEVYGGLDLSGRADLTALVLVALHKGRWHVRPHFWTPEKGLVERSKRDRAQYDVWAKQGFIATTPGASIDYEFVARDIAEIASDINLKAIAFDRWRIDLLKKELEELGLTLPLVPFGQGFKDMTPALETLESLLLNEQMAHGGHPVLTMCAANARTERDAAGNRKLSKGRTTGRIDGLVALTMAVGCMNTAPEAEQPKKYQMMFL